jgi:hypothetical protein
MKYEKKKELKKRKKNQVSPSEPCKLRLNSQIHNLLNFLSRLNPGA